MAFTINNLTSRPIIIPLNSGAHLRLSPGEESGEIHEVEFQDNAKMGKLEQQRAIAVNRRDDDGKPAKADDSADKSKTDEAAPRAGGASKRTGSSKSSA